MPTTKKVASSNNGKSATTARSKSSIPKNSKSTKATKKVAAKTKSTILPRERSLITREVLTKNTHKEKISIQTIDKSNKSIKSKLPSLQLALLSPYRFPINAERLAVSTARFGGVFFVAIGAFFSLFFASGSFSGSAQLAQLSAAATDTGAAKNTSIMVDCTDPLHYMSTSCAASIDKTPDVAFQVDTTGSISGIVRVRAIVAHADKVVLNAYYKTQPRELKISSMQKLSDDTWEFYWDTANFDDGDYKLKVLVTNGYGTYEAVDARYLALENRPLSISGSGTVSSLARSATSSNSGTTTVTASTAKTSAAVLSVQANMPLSEFNFEVSTDRADKIKIFAYNVESSKNTLLGYAVKATATTWKYKWSAASFAEGEYRINAQIIADSIENTSNTLSISLKKPLASDVTAVDTKIASTVAVPLDIQILKPEAIIQVQASSPISLFTGIKISVSSAAKVELYVQERFGLAKKYLGMATNIDADTWVYGLDSTKIPNGEYKIIANIKNQYGQYEDESAFIKIKNTEVVLYTQKQEEQVSILADIGTEARKSSVELKQVPSSVQQAEIVTEDGTEAAVDPEELLSQDEEQNILTDFDARIEAELQRLSAAFRMNDQKAIISAKTRLESLKQQMLLSEYQNDLPKEITAQIDARLQSAIGRTEEDVKVTEKIITERTEKEASVDSDTDGVADYDEVAIYRTDPFAADSDNDGFNDGAEILNGYDPTDPSAETLVAFELPMEAGVVREDILAVYSVITAAKNEDDAAVEPIAIISGKALPNSFVTLYIFSTPTIVTVKTEADGSWNYRFDKELENGEHQVYVGVTDNAGKIVAKSSPFSFIKTAEAFSPVDMNTEKTAPVIVQQKTFLSEYMIYLVLSISVVAIGLVLILLGLYLDSRQRKIGVVTQETVPAV